MADGAAELYPAMPKRPGIPNADEARVKTEALSNGGDDGRGLFRGWWAV